MRGESLTVEQRLKTTIYFFEYEAIRAKDEGERVWHLEAAELALFFRRLKEKAAQLEELLKS